MREYNRTFFFLVVFVPGTVISTSLVNGQEQESGARSGRTTTGASWNLGMRIPEFEIRVASLRDVVDDFFVRHGVRVNMESIEYDYTNPRIFLTFAEWKDQLRAKEAIVPLEAGEKAQLEMYEARVVESEMQPSELLIDVKYRKLVDGFVPVKLKDITLKNLLDELVRRDPDYQWEAPAPGTIRVLPKGNGENRYARSVLGWEFPTVATPADGMPLMELFEEESLAGRALTEHGIQMIPAQWLTGEEKVVVTIPPGTAARDALDLIAAGMGPQYRWYYHNTTGTDTIIFNTRIRVPRATEEK